MLNITEHNLQDKYTLIVHKVNGELLVVLISHCACMVWQGEHTVEQIAEEMSINVEAAQAVYDFMVRR